MAILIEIQDKNALMTTLTTLTQALQLKTPPARMPPVAGVYWVDDSGVKTRLGEYKYSPAMVGMAMAELTNKVSLLLPDAEAKAIAEKVADIAIRASEAFPMTTKDVIMPGGTSPVTSLQLDDEVNAVLLVGIVTSKTCGEMFLAKSLTVGPSQLVSQSQTLSPATDLNGMTLAVYANDGSDKDDVLPFYNIVYAAETNKPVKVTAIFTHPWEFGPLAYAARAHLTFLCLVNRIPKGQCHAGRVAEIFERLSSAGC